MRLHISHSTLYTYSLPARSSINELRLSPEETARQRPGEVQFTISPTAELRSSRDLFGNLVHHFEVDPVHLELEVIAESVVETLPNRESVEHVLTVPLEKLPGLARDEALHDFIIDSACVDRDAETWKEAMDVQAAADPKTCGDLANAVSRHVFETCVYCHQEVHVMRTASQVQRERTGSCQDYTHLFISYCRLLGLPARYVSGYLYDPSEGDALADGVVGAGFTHAWADVFVPEVGWVGIDPTNRQWVDDRYVSLAFGRDYRDVVPIRGSIIGGGRDRKLQVEVCVRSVSGVVND